MDLNPDVLSESCGGAQPDAIRHTRARPAAQQSPARFEPIFFAWGSMFEGVIVMSDLGRCASG